MDAAIALVFNLFGLIIVVGVVVEEIMVTQILLIFITERPNLDTLETLKFKTKSDDSRDLPLLFRGRGRSRS